MNELVKVNEGSLELAQEAIEKIKEVEVRIKELEAIQKDYKAKLLEIMEANDILKFDNETITITRKEATTRATLDSKLLQEELPDVYIAYAKTSNVKGSITIKVK